MTHTLKLTTPHAAATDFELAMHQAPMFGPCKDPCEYVIRYGGAAFQGIVNRAEDAIDYKFRQLIEDYIGKGPNARTEAIRKAIDWFAVFMHYRTGLDHPACVDAVKRGQIYTRLSILSGMLVSEIRAMIEARQAKEPKSLPYRPGGASPFVVGDAVNDPKRMAALEALDSCDDEPWEQP